MPNHASSKRYTVTPDQELYHAYSTSEDRERTNVHYEQPPAFFYQITGGEWNVYSANLWDHADNDTASQTAKLDLLAEQLQLRPGMRILDVGCGWGGPLVYQGQRYGVRGVGLTLSSTQRRAAEARAAKYGVDAQILEQHWQEYEPDEPFDAALTDEVIVHFNDLGGFFRSLYRWLRPDGRMVNKELHFVHPRYERMTRAGAFVNDIYGQTGNYRTLLQELQLVQDAGFSLEGVVTIPRRNYHRTLDRWMANMYAAPDKLIELVGKEHFRRFRTYLRLAHRIVENMTLDVVVCEKPSSSKMGIN